MTRHCSVFRLLLAALVLTTLASPLPAQKQNARVVQPLDRNWTFQYFPQSEPDKHWTESTADDSRWPAVALPHTWNVYETTREEHPFIKHATEREDAYWWYGWGWYRKHFKLSRGFSSKEVSLEFDGIQKVAFVYVNGHLAGEHKGGYTSFSVDITRWLHFGSDNIVAVQVSNRRDDNFGHVPPMTAGNFDVYGGIYRGARLVITDKVHVPFQGSATAEGGTFITTPQVNHNTAVVHATTWVRNDRDTTVTIRAQSTILDAGGSIIATLESPLTLQPGELKSVEQAFPQIAKPHLWSPSSPYVYNLETALLENGHKLDTFHSTFGVRWFSWNTREHKLYLNGSPIRLIGTNRHQEFPWLGDAMPVWMQLDDLHDMHDNLGYNFQRTAHYPQAPEVYDFCDHNGIIVLEESPNIKDIDFGRDIQEQTMREMIRRDRNHPSIMFWGIGNETDHPADSSWAWQEDKTRIINLRRGTNGGDHVMTTDDDLALEQTLRCTVRGWYNDDAHNFALGTGEPASGQVTGTEEWQHTTDMQSLEKKGEDNVVVFLYADHGADRIYRNAPLKYVNPKGWVDGLRFPKYVYYLWQANFTQKPMVFIHPWPWQQRYVGQRKDITIDSNADAVELLVDGKSLGIRKPTDANVHVVTFQNVEVTHGILGAIGHKGNQAVTEDLRMAGEPARLQLHVRSAHLEADRSGLAIVEVRAIDANGVEVPYIHPDVAWSVSGEGRLVGPSELKTDTNKNNSDAGTMYIDLPTANLIRTTGTPGELHIAVSSPGLAGDSIVLQSEPASKLESGVEEVVLHDEGRFPVTRDPNVNEAARSTPPRVFEHIGQDYNLRARTLNEARTSMDNFLHEHNPKLSRDSRAYDNAVDKLSQLLFENHGNLIADWYNFTADRYEDTVTLMEVVGASPVPTDVKAELERGYADRMLLQSEALDIAGETSALKAALGTATFVTRSLHPAPGVQHANATTLGELMAQTYPHWAELTPAQQADVLRIVQRFNPNWRHLNIAPETPLPDAAIVLPKESIVLR